MSELRTALIGVIDLHLDSEATHYVDPEEIADVVLDLVTEPDRTPHGLALCKVCRTPVREPEPEAKAAKQCHEPPTTAKEGTA